MLQVQVFDEEHEDDLSEAINLFLYDHPLIQVQDIRFSTAIAIQDEDTQIYCFSALLLYLDTEDESRV